MNQNKREFTGIHIGTAEDWEGFFLAKAAKEKKLGRLLTNDEIHELLEEVKKKENIESIWVEEKQEKVREALKKEFNVKDVKPRGDNKNV